MQDTGYQTAFFGKYLNKYKGKRVPPGWNHWVGLLKNSRYYNYTLNINGRLKRHGDSYERDYFTNVITDHSIEYFTERKRKHPNEPVFMMVSMSAPHGPEDGAPPYQNRFPDVRAPRLPNYNRTCLDKHWLIRATPPLSKVTERFTDVLYRKRLQTLLSLDDAVEKLYNMLVTTDQIHNTYFVFSSDHGYHIGQFNQVKGKNGPYESDVRIPLYMSGPNIPRGIKVDNIALNIDFAPSFLDIAKGKLPGFIDGSSFMDVAAGGAVNSIGEKFSKTAWKDTFLIERSKLHKVRQREHKKRLKENEHKPKTQPPGLHCFRMTAQHWRNPPYWEGPSFTSCNNAANSTYWCLRTLNDTHNYLYCEFVTGFLEYFDMKTDPYQLTNIVHTLPADRLSRLHKLLMHMRTCRGSVNCFVRHGETFSRSNVDISTDTNVIF